MHVPEELDRRRVLGEPWTTWLDRLPRLARDLVAEWVLVPDGEPMHGHCSLVLPVLAADGAACVLKIGLPDEESEHEALALQHWAGEGAVRLLRADPRRRAMLLERLHPHTLEDLRDVEACEVVGDLLRRLHVPAPARLRPLSSYVERWSGRLALLPRDAPVPHRLVEQAVAQSADLLREAPPGRLLHTDLHYDNVLAADREPWLAIDPKPVSGDPHYEVAPLLWNRWAELAGDVRPGVRRRFHAVVDAAGLDEDRARAWVVVRALHTALWCLEDDPGLGRAETRDLLTTRVAVAKAVQG